MNLLATLLKKRLRKWKVNKKSENSQRANSIFASDIIQFFICFFGTYHQGWKLNNALFADMSKDLEKPDAFKVK